MTDDEPPEQPNPKTPIEIASVDATRDAATAQSPIPGMSTQEFGNWLIRAIEGDPAVPASIQLAVSAGMHDADGHGDKKDREWWQRMWQFVLDQQLREIDRLIAHYNALADWHHEQAELARGKMREAGEKLGAIDDFLTGANKALRDKEKTGKLDREKAITLLKARGIAVDSSMDDGRLVTLLVQQQEAARNERAGWSKQYEQSSADATTHEQLERENREKAKELVQKRDEIRNHGYDAREETLRLRQVTEAYQMNVQDTAADIESLRSKDASNNATVVQREAFQQMRAKQSTSEVDDFAAMAAGALSGEFAKAAKGNELTPTPMPPATPGSNGGPPASRNSFG